MAKDSSTPLSIIIFFTIISTFLVYVMSVYGLCREKVDALNQSAKFKNLKIIIEQLKGTDKKVFLGNLFSLVKKIRMYSDQSNTQPLTVLNTQYDALIKKMHSDKMTQATKNVFLGCA